MFSERIKPAFPLAILFLAIISCSVKEDRDDCPCRLDLFFTDRHLPAVITLDAGETVLVDTVRKSGVYSTDVPRGVLRLNAYSGDGGCFRPGEGFYVRDGSQCPPVYMCSRTISAESMHAKDTVTLHKNYCKITLKVKTDDGIRRFTWRLALRGGVCGYDLEGRPARGAFSFTDRVSEEIEFVCCVPRQMDDSMMLEIRDDPDVLRSFAVGEFIAESGYDWSRPDLEDIVMEIDYSRTGVTFNVSDWKRTISFDVVI